MTIAFSSSNPVQYLGNGTAVIFGFPWKIFAPSDLIVGFIVGGVYSQQTSGFTVTMPGVSAGFVTFSTAPPGGTTVDLRPLTPETQPTDFANLGAYLPENTTNAFDRLTRMVQDLTRLAYTFGVHAADQENTAWPSLPSPSARAGQVLGFDINGLPTLVAGVGTPSQGQAAAGVYSSVFQSGYLQYTGPNQSFAANTSFIVGTQLPNPSGTPAPALLVGSGVPQAWIITDTWGSPGQPGINLGITAGETAPTGTDTGGSLSLYGGAAAAGTGGATLVQGGTSLNGPGGATTIAGGNSTTGAAGDVFVIGGQNGTAGANVHLIMTQLNGVSGDVRIRVNSTILWQFLSNGALAISGNEGFVGQVLTSGGVGVPAQWQSPGTGVVVPGNFTATLSGGFVVNPTGTLNFEIVSGSTVHLWTSTDITGSPNGSDDVVISGIPLAIQPLLNRTVLCDSLSVGGSFCIGQVTVFAAGGGNAGTARIRLYNTINAGTGTAIGSATAAWSASIAKGISSGWFITYAL